MGIERRQQARTACSIPCAVQGDSGKAVDGIVCDVSAGGLSVQVDLPADQGDSVAVTLQHGRSGSIEVRGIVWHVRRGRMKGSSKILQRLGIVLSEAPDEFLSILPRPKSTPAPPTPSSPPSAVKESAPASKRSASPPPEKVKLLEPAPPVRFRIRVKQQGGPRTRTILVFAKDDAEARTLARVETGEGWNILEVEQG